MTQIRETIREFFVGVDLGQKQDFTALCVVERAEVMFEARDPVTWECKRETRFTLRYLERVALRTPYPEVLERIRQVAMDPALGASRCLIVDATGVGGPIVDLLRAARINCEIMAVVITGGSSGAGNAGLERRVAKRDLIVGLQLMFDLGQLRIAEGLPETELFMKELMGMRVRMSASGHESYGKGPEGPHDDLVLAVALACWRAKERGEWNWYGGKPDCR